jgi:hypothetical protein
MGHSLSREGSSISGSFMEPEDSLLCSNEAAAGMYRELSESNLHRRNLFI